MTISKRYKDIFEQYIHKGEPTPLTIGTLVVCILCFLLLVVATFTQLNFSHPWLKYTPPEGFSYVSKSVSYNPLIPLMIFIIYLLGKSYSCLTFIIYLLIGFFVWPIFVFGGTLDYVQNYLFGYLLGFAFAIIISGSILKISQTIKYRLFAALAGVFAIHICGFLYCIILAIFKVIDFNLIIPILNVISMGNMLYDIIFSCLIIIIAPYIKNVFWICMKPKADLKRKLKNSRKRNQIISDDVYQHRQNYD